MLATCHFLLWPVVVQVCSLFKAVSTSTLEICALSVFMLWLNKKRLSASL